MPFFAVELAPYGWRLLSQERFLLVSEPDSPVGIERASIFSDHDLALAAIPDAPPWRYPAPSDHESELIAKESFRIVHATPPELLLSGIPSFCILFEDGWLAAPGASSICRSSIGSPDGFGWSVSEDPLCAMSFHSPELALAHVERVMARTTGNIPPLRIVSRRTSFEGVETVGEPGHSPLTGAVTSACESSSLGGGREPAPMRKTSPVSP